MTESVWLIVRYDSLEEVGRWELPGHYKRETIAGILQRLACVDLTPAEIIDACREKGDPLNNHLLDPIGPGESLHYGHNPWMTAKLVERGEDYIAE